jgi:nitrogen fixation protein NifB
LPVSPSCNIQCNFCTRDKNASEQRPGVANKVVTPKEVSEILSKALKLCPEIKVVGIAGPGDALADDSAVKSFEYINKTHPELIKCISTNGLLLPQKAKDLWDVGVKSITVTVNAVFPEILEKINSYIFYGGIKLTGIDAAEILIKNQLEGIKKASGLGSVIKVNTVLIPSINDKHISEIAKTVKKSGADKYNIIPLIPNGKFKNFSVPTCDDLADARKAAEKYIEVFYHCKHCRADACGIPGKVDLSQELYGTRELDTFSHG